MSWLLPAYIDPPSTSVFVGQVWPLIVAGFAAGGAFALRLFWYPIRERARRILRFLRRR